MTRFLTTMTIAALAIVTLTAAAGQQQRYRFLGRTAQGVVMATEATGPQNARKLRAVFATLAPDLPGLADNAEAGIIIDCVNNTAAVDGMVTYLGNQEKIRTEARTLPAAINGGSRNELVAAMACGKPIAGTPVWLDGPVMARLFAMAEVRK